jgi:NADP-dependent 3-hydroxy acid dehydrogenase YdfG
MKSLAIVTGSGIGAAMARRFADGGYQIAMIARSAELDALARDLPDSLAVVRAD